MSERLIEKNANLIYDVGMHQGEDAEFYLKKGFSVVAFEANPDLVADNKEKFADDIRSGKLTIVEGAIVDDPSNGHVQFFRNKDETIWGTVCEDWAKRNDKKCTSSEIIKVPTVDFSQCLKEYHMPYYMKIDIEGADIICLRHLASFKARPNYVSIESNKVSFVKLYQEIALLEDLGYVRFKAIQQQWMKRTRAPVPAREGKDCCYNFAKNSSGLFGKELAGQWLDTEGIVNRYVNIFLDYSKYGDNSFWEKNRMTRFIKKSIGFATGVPLPGWYDTHAMHVSEYDLIKENK